MTFKWLNNQGVESDAGYVVQFTGRYSMEYRLAGKKVKIDIELGASGQRTVILVYSRSIDQWSEGLFKKTEMTDNQRREILDNMRDALVYMDLDIQIR